MFLSKSLWIYGKIPLTQGIRRHFRRVSDLFLPVSGEITEVNENLDDNPELVISDPYVEGWMIKLKITDINDMNLLLSADEYSELTQ